MLNSEPKIRWAPKGKGLAVDLATKRKSQRQKKHQRKVFKSSDLSRELDSNWIRQTFLTLIPFTSNSRVFMTVPDIAPATEPKESSALPPPSTLLTEESTTIPPKETTELDEPATPIKLKPWSKEWMWEVRGSMFVIVLTISLAVFTDIFIYAMIVPVVPFAFVDRMGVSPDAVQTQVSIALGVFSTGMIVAALVFGYVADRIKQRQTLMMGAIVVIIGCTLMICLAKTTALFFVGRFFQGFSGGLVWTVGLAIIADSADVSNMAYYMSFPAIATSSGMFLGPLIGGIMYERLGYYAVFYVSFGILVLDLLLRVFMLEKSQLRIKRHKRALELSEQGPSTLSPEMVLYMNAYITHTNQSEEYKKREKELQQIHGTFFTISGKRFRMPVLLELIKEVRVLNALFLSIAIAWMMTFFDTTTPLHVEDIFHFNSEQSGYVFLALAVPSIFEPFVGKMCDKYGYRYTIAGGYLLMAPILVLFRLPTKKTTGDIVMFVAFVAIMGFLIMGVLSPIMAEVSAAVGEIESRHPGIYGKSKGYGQAYGLFNVGFSLGSLIGTFHSGETRKHAGWNMLTVSLAIVAVGVAVIAAIFTEGNIFKKKSKKEATEVEV